MKRIFGWLGLIILVWSLAIAPPAHAASCRPFNQHTICILNIKRSAKNYWEYRVTLSVDGVEQPEEIYNCRDRTHIRKNGSVISFTTEDPGELICRYFRR